MSNKEKEKTRLTVVSWREIKTNPYQQHLHPDMFSPKGLNIRKQAKLKGSTHLDSPTDCIVTYDKDFVTKKLANIFKPLVDNNFGTELILHYCRTAITEAERITGVENDEQV